MAENPLDYSETKEISKNPWLRLTWRDSRPCGRRAGRKPAQRSGFHRRRTARAVLRMIPRIGLLIAPTIA